MADLKILDLEQLEAHALKNKVAFALLLWRRDCHIFEFMQIDY